MHRPRGYGHFDRGDLKFCGERPGVQLEVVVETQSLLARLGNEEYFDVDVKLTPTV